MPDDLESTVTEWQAAGDAWVAAKLKSDQLEEDAKSFLAAMINELEDKLPRDAKVIETRLDRRARGTKKYREFIKGMCAARADALIKKVRFDALEKMFEARRSELALERAKIEKGIFHAGR